MATSNSDQSSERASPLASEELARVTQTPIRRQQTLEFAGFLTHEDQDSVYIADPQGTWVIRRDDLVSMEDWTSEGAPKFMTGAGRAVRVSVRDGATIHEIRPWRIQRHAGAFGAELQQVVQKVFTLGGAAPPITERTLMTELQLANVERAYGRRIGWSPDYVPGTDLSISTHLRAESKTLVLSDGY